MKGVNLMGFYAPMIALLISIVWIGITIVGKNINAKDLVFSYTALAAALVMFSLNLLFSLKNENITHVVQPTLAINQTCVDVYSILPSKSSFVAFGREDLSSYLNINMDCGQPGLPELTEDEHITLKKKLAEFLRISVIGHLLCEHPDWNPYVKNFRGSRSVRFNNTEAGAGKNSYYSVSDLAKVLKIGLKDFELSKHIGITRGLTLPPKTIIYSNGENLTLENPHIKIEIEFEIEDRMQYITPEETNTNLSFISIQSNIIISATQKKQRSGSPERLKYESWAIQISNTIQDGFSPAPTSSK